jgi:hypothetical protein
LSIGVTNIINELSNPIDWDKKAKEKAKREGINVNEILDE